MALTKVSRGLLSTGIVDNSNAMAITIDSSENIGLGLAPTNFANRTSLDIGLGGKIWGHAAATETGHGSNFYFDGAYKRIAAVAPTRHVQNNDGHTFSVSASGAANSTITWNDALIVSPSGGVNIGSGASISPDADADNLVVQENGAAGITIGSSASSVGSIRFADSGSPRAGMIYYNHVGNEMRFYTNASERARLDSSGNFLVGKTSPSTNTVGVEARADGTFAAVKSSGGAAVFGRNTNDGTIVGFRKDGANVGAIGTLNGSLYIASFYANDSGLRFSDRIIHPCTTAGAPRDNAIDLGYSAGRFDDIFATNGTIQTSDRNEKQDIEELSEAEKRVAVAAKGLMRKFRWKDAVADKSDNARIHVGIIAQDLQAAFEAEGLDAAHYAMFCSDTWTNDDGTEQTRLGVRYSELLAFIISAI
jgi:hypothetical protein